MQPKLLLFSSRPEDKAFAEEVARTASLECVVTEDLASTIAAIQEMDFSATLIDASYDERFNQFESALKEDVGLFSEKTNTNRIHLLCSEDLEYMKHLTKSPLFGNFVLRRFNDEAGARAAGQRYGHVVRASLQERAFGMQHFFGDKAQIQKIQLQKASQKQQVVEAVRSYLVKARYPSRMANVIANAVDELIMNSIFTAPTDELGKKIYDLTPRNAEIELVGRHGVEVTVVFDERRVGISACDHFGAIDKDKLVNHLSTVYNDTQYKVKNSVAGAGIGLATVFRSGGSLVFICEKGSKTEVGVIYERFDSHRAFKGQFRFISTQFYY